jgi:hypothetical protein
MDKRHIGVLQDSMFQKPAPEEGLLRRPLGDFDVCIDSAVLLVKRESGGIVLLGVSDCNYRTGQRYISARQIRCDVPGLGSTADDRQDE